MFDLFYFDNPKEILERIFDKETINLLGVSEQEAILMPKNSLLYEQGELLEYLYFVVNGQIVICSPSEENKFPEKCVISAPTWLGEFEVLNKEKYLSNRVKTVTDIQYYKIKISNYINCFEKKISFAKDVAKRMAKYTAYFFQENQISLNKSNEAILLRYFLNLLKQNKELQEFCLLNQTRNDLSLKTGISIRTLNRLLAKLQKEQIIEIRRGKICLLQLKYSFLEERLKKLS